MNERIQQMIYNLNEKVGVHWTNEDKLKFAELIVRECARVSERTGVLNEADFEGEMIADAVKEHFGVEE